MASSLNQSAPIAKTAFDSLQAKQSAHSVGYTPMVTRNEECYQDLLNTATIDWKVRRQTPLVNAGYAARVLAVSHSIDNWVKYHQHVHPETKLQIVFFGCGIDVIGIWSRSLVERSGLIRIVELDMPSVCATKKQFLTSKGLVMEMPGPNITKEDELVGQIVMSDKTNLSQPDYFLLPVDLMEISALDRILDGESFIMDPFHVPTLVVSELVLAYLPPDKTDQLLTWCSSKLIQTPDSAMLLLEPLGHDETQSKRTTSVLEGYRRDYCQLFQRKMERGKSTTNTPKSDSEAMSKISSPFYPIGVSSKSVEERLRRAGFQTADVTTLGSAAAHSSSGSDFQIPEIFDEHAALILHLQSYVVATAFLHNSDTLLLRMLCPARNAVSEIPPVLTEDRIVYTVLERRDEVAMRDLFRETYVDLFDDYPAIRKMVKGIMNREFAPSLDDGNEKADSEITARYKSQGGCFFVAARYTQDKAEREVIGCVGVRCCERKDDPHTLEVFRLAVHESCRGKGIGRGLLQMVESFARSRQSPKLIAHTITCLERALLAYEACGFNVEKDSPLGSLTMRTYFKTLS
jgi:GNAT superfamily N-acetyltransferase/O-methyltransferase involved in polyketide biosynthesis